VRSLFLMRVRCLPVVRVSCLPASPASRYVLLPTRVPPSSVVPVLRPCLQAVDARLAGVVVFGGRGGGGGEGGGGGGRGGGGMDGGRDGGREGEEEKEAKKVGKERESDWLAYGAQFHLGLQVHHINAWLPPATPPVWSGQLWHGCLWHPRTRGRDHTPAVHLAAPFPLHLPAHWGVFLSKWSPGPASTLYPS